MTLVLIGKGLALGGLPFENRSHLGPVLGIYNCMVPFSCLSPLPPVVSPHLFWSCEGIGTTTTRSQSKIAKAHSEGFLCCKSFFGVVFFLLALTSRIFEDFWWLQLHVQFGNRIWFGSFRPDTKTYRLCGDTAWNTVVFWRQMQPQARLGIETMRCRRC